MGPLFNPPMRANDPSGKQAALMCPTGAVNITHPPVADPESGVMYIMSRYSCGSRRLVSGEEADTYYDEPTGITLSRYARQPAVAHLPGILPEFHFGSLPIAESLRSI